MELAVLGPLTATVGGVSFVPSAAKSRKVLALLMLNANRFVSIGAFQRELWGEQPPRSALTTLQTYILQLRKRLAEALPPGAGSAKDVLVTQPMGYMLRATPGSLDAALFDELTGQAQQARAAGDMPATARLLNQALALWRGVALADVEAGPVLDGQLMRLRESRMAALEQRIEADIVLGNHRQTLSELTAMTVEHPHNENVHALLMDALYRSGRRAQALQVYQDLRRSLVDGLGLEPSRRLRELHQGILSGRLDVASPTVGLQPAV